jgi:hypothetical protein
MTHKAYFPTADFQSYNYCPVNPAASAYKTSPQTTQVDAEPAYEAILSSQYSISC